MAPQNSRKPPPPTPKTGEARFTPQQEASPSNVPLSTQFVTASARKYSPQPILGKLTLQRCHEGRGHQSLARPIGRELNRSLAGRLDGTRPPKSGSADRKGTEPKLSWPIRRDTAKVLPMPTTTAAVSQNSRKTTHPNPKNSERQVHPTARSLTLRRLTINPIRLCIQTKVLAPGHFGKAPLNPAPGTPQTAELCKLKLRITAIPNPHSAQSYHR
jgi:hypothetical protein